APELADHRRAPDRGPARNGARRRAATAGRALGVEDGPGLYRTADHTRRPRSPSIVADTGDVAVPDPRRLGHRQRCAVRGAGAADDGGPAERRARRHPQYRTRPNPGRTGGAGRTGAPPRGDVIL